MSEENNEQTQGGEVKTEAPKTETKPKKQAQPRKPRTRKTEISTLPNEKRYKEEGDLLIPV